MTTDNFLLHFVFRFVSVVPQPVYMNTNDLAELAAQKKRDQQMCQYQGYNPNEVCDDSQDLKTPTAENQQILVDNKVVIFILCLLVFTLKRLFHSFQCNFDNIFVEFY